MEAMSSSLPIFERELEATERRVKALRQVVEGLRALNGHAPLVPATVEIPGVSPAVIAAAAAAPKGTAAVAAITGERPGRWTRREIMQEFAKRGWFHTNDRRKAEGAVDAAIHRLCRLGRGRVVDPGIYEFPASDNGGGGG